MRISSTILRTFLLLLALINNSHLLAAPDILGNGYDSLMLSHRRSNCITGESIEVKYSENSSSLSMAESWTQLQNKMNFEVPGSVFLARGSELAKFAIRARDTNYSSTYILKNYVATKRFYLKNPEIIDNLDEREDFRSKCGNEYISLVTQGGRLYVGIKFSFSNSRFKELFDAGGAIKTITGLGAHIDSLTKQVRQNSSVEIFYHQVGGNISELNSMFESSEIIACSLDNFDVCEGLLEGIWNYSSDTFVKAVMSGKDQTIGFERSSYPGVPITNESVDVKKQRLLILEALDQQHYDLDYFVGLKGKTNKYKDFSDRDLNILISKTLSNIRTLKDSVILSFERSELFLKNNTINKLNIYMLSFPVLKKDYLKYPRILWDYLKPHKYMVATTMLSVVVPIILVRLGFFTKFKSFFHLHRGTRSTSTSTN